MPYLYVGDGGHLTIRSGPADFTSFMVEFMNEIRRASESMEILLDKVIAHLHWIGHSKVAIGLCRHTCKKETDFSIVFDIFLVYAHAEGLRFNLNHRAASYLKEYTRVTDIKCVDI